MSSTTTETETDIDTTTMTTTTTTTVTKNDRLDRLHDELRQRTNDHGSV